jgi:hypothetical protein
MKIIFCLVILLTLFINPTVAQINTAEDCEKINFRFIVLGTETYTPVSRQVFVFLDEKAFSENNLQNLFVYLAKQYTDKKILIINVWTNWEQIPLPVDCTYTGIPHTGNEKPEEFKFHYASYRQDDKGTFFIYNPVLNTEKYKKVIIKSK